MELRGRQEDAGEEYEESRRGWCVGSEAFRKELLAAASGRAGPNHYGAAKRESDLAKAERLVAGRAGGTGLAEEDLARRLKGDKEKVKLARQLRKETTVTLAWVAQRLRMGSWTYVADADLCGRKTKYKRLGLTLA